MTVVVLCLFLMVPLAGLWCVIVAFPGHTHLLYIPSESALLLFFFSLLFLLLQIFVLFDSLRPINNIQL